MPILTRAELRDQFGDEFKLDIHEPLSCIEIEFQSVDTRGNKEALGMIRHVVSDIPTQASENWYDFHPLFVDKAAVPPKVHRLRRISIPGGCSA